MAGKERLGTYHNLSFIRSQGIYDLIFPRCFATKGLFTYNDKRAMHPSQAPTASSKGKLVTAFENL